MIDININNFNVFVLVCTILFYVMLRYYKHSILMPQNANRKSNLIYISFVPFVLYSFYYWFIYKKQGAPQPQPGIMSENISSTELLSSPYPNSSL